MHSRRNSKQSRIQSFFKPTRPIPTKTIIIIMGILLLGAVGLLTKYIFIDSPKEEEKIPALRYAHKKAYQKGIEAAQLEQKGDLYSAAEKYIEAADKLKAGLRENPEDLSAPAIKKRMIYLYQRGIDLFTQDALQQPVDKVAEVTYIFDGDTVGLEDRNRVRYLGIDTPESDSPWGKKASEANALMVKNKTVQLKSDKERMDKYGRTLAYVFYEDLFVNAELVKIGLARCYYPVGSHLKYGKLFSACESLAKENKVGMWKEIFQ